MQVIFNVFGPTYPRDFAEELIPVMLFIKVYRDVRHLLIGGLRFLKFLLILLIQVKINEHCCRFGLKEFF